MNLSLNIFSSIPCWLIPLLVGAICAILGYLLGRLFGGGENNNTVDLDVYKNRISKLETDLAACKASKDVVSRSSGAGNTVSSFAAGAREMVLNGIGLAWVPMSLVSRKIESGELTDLSEVYGSVALKISLYARPKGTLNNAIVNKLKLLRGH